MLVNIFEHTNSGEVGELTEKLREACMCSRLEM